MVDVPQCVLQDLRCHKCDQYLSRSPVYLDEQGTQICSQCYKPSVPATRNITYEAVAQLMRFPCRYHDLGCPVTIPFLLDNVEDHHEESCEYHPFHCPIMRSVGCPWIGIRSNMMEHCYIKHPDRVLDNPISLSHDITKSSENYFIITGFGLIFLLKVKVCLKTDKMIYSIACLDYHTSRFQCSLDIKRYFNVISRYAELLPNESSSVSVSISCMVDVFDGFDGTVFTFTINEIGDEVSNESRVCFGTSTIDCLKESNRNSVRDSSKPSNTDCIKISNSYSSSRINFLHQPWGFAGLSYITELNKNCADKFREDPDTSSCKKQKNTKFYPHTSPVSKLLPYIACDKDIPPKLVCIENNGKTIKKKTSFEDTCMSKPKQVLCLPVQQPELKCRSNITVDCPNKKGSSKSSRLVTNIPSDVDIVTPPKQVSINRTYKISSFQDTCFPKPKKVVLCQSAQQPESNRQGYTKDSQKRKCAGKCCVLFDENIIQPKQTCLENNNKKTYEINSLQGAFCSKPKQEVLCQSNMNIGCPNEKCAGKRSTSVSNEDIIITPKLVFDENIDENIHKKIPFQGSFIPRSKQEVTSQPVQQAELYHQGSINKDSPNRKSDSKSPRLVTDITSYEDITIQHKQVFVENYDKKTHTKITFQDTLFLTPKQQSNEDKTRQPKQMFLDKRDKSSFDDTEFGTDSITVEKQKHVTWDNKPRKEKKLFANEISFLDTFSPKRKHEVFSQSVQPESDISSDEDIIISPKQVFVENNDKKVHKKTSSQDTFLPKPKKEILYQLVQQSAHEISSDEDIIVPHKQVFVGNNDKKIPKPKDEVLSHPAQQPDEDITIPPKQMSLDKNDKSSFDDTEFEADSVTVEKQKRVSTDNKPRKEKKLSANEDRNLPFTNTSICTMKEKDFCKNRGCSYKDTSYKLWKHTLYFCPYAPESRCSICSNSIPRHSLHQHYDYAHNNITIANGGTWRAVQNCTGHFFVDTPYGTVIGWYSRKNNRFVLNLYSPLSSNELKNIRCTIKFKNDLHMSNLASRRCGCRRCHAELYENYDWTMQRSDFPEQILEFTVNIDDSAKDNFEEKDFSDW